MADEKESGTAEGCGKRWFSPDRRVVTMVAAIVVLAGALRVVRLGQSPPGLNQDEAANAWNAYCLLKTGRDQVGVRWPIFYSRCLGENRSTLFFYYLIPFQVIGGLDIWTLRFAAAVGGIAAVLLTYLVGARLFGRPVGLMSAAFLAVNPWHVQLTRWGHEASLGPLLVLLPLALGLWAGLPLGDKPGRSRPVVAFFAGIMGGVLCYGYPAVRLFLPAFAVAVVVINWRAWGEYLKSRGNVMAAGAAILGAGLTFGALAVKHLTDPNIGKRGQTMWVWAPSDSTATKVGKVVRRYAGHFGPDFLFVQGDHSELHSPPGFGEFHWYMAPLMGVGLVAAIGRARTSRSGRVLLAWIALYPVGDCIAHHGSASVLRSAPGLPGLIMLAGLGAIVAGGFLFKRWRRIALCVTGAFLIAVVILNVRFLHFFFGPYNRLTWPYHGFNIDLLEACDWLKPRFQDVDAVFCTVESMNQPYIITLVALDYDPRQWFRDKRQVLSMIWDYYGRYGKVHFMYGNIWLGDFQRLLKNGRRDRVVFILRPDEAQGLKLRNPTLRITRPDGLVVLEVYAVYL